MRVGRIARTPEEKKRIYSGNCVQCGKPRNSKRRKVYCSAECHDEYWYSHDWSWLRSKILKRDKFKCAKCGFQLKPVEHWFIVENDPNGFSKNKVVEIKKYYNGPVVAKGYYSAPLIVDHIKPVALYPELEFEASNLQVLCQWCNKVKTKNDLGYIAEVKREEKETEELAQFAKTHRSILEYVHSIGP